MVRSTRLALAVLVLMAPREATAQATAQVTVQVQDEQGRPVPGAAGQLGGLSATAGPDGLITFAPVTAGTHTLTIRAIGFRPDQRELVIGRELTVRFTVTLAQMPVMLAPVIVEATRPGLYGIVSTVGLQPLADAEVHLMGRRSRTVRTDSLGRFSHPDAEGPYMVRVSARGHEDLRLSVAVPEGGGREVLVQLNQARPGYRGASNRERWMHHELSFRLAWANPLNVLTRAELEQYGVRSICEVPQLAAATRMMQAQRASTVIDGDFQVPDPCMIRVHQVLLVEWGTNSCSPTAMGASELFRGANRRMPEAGGQAGRVRRQIGRCPPYLHLWLSN